jgi:hypothetical protein
MVDYVGGDDRRPISEVRDGDEIFVVNVKGGRLRIGGRFLVDGRALSEEEAERKVGAEGLIGKKLYVFGKQESLDTFHVNTYLDQSKALALELIDVNGRSKTPEREPGNPRAIYRQEFRQPMRLTEGGAATLRACLGLRAAQEMSPNLTRLTNPSAIDDTKESSGLSLEHLLKRISANEETGRLGEGIALAAERRRVATLRCLDATAAVRHISPVQVDAGFDIESNWNGERRCIEVKSSTTDGLGFFISENERRILKELRQQAWLYRVKVRPDGTGEVVEMLQDPIARIGEDCFKPVVWQVRRKAD